MAKTSKKPPKGKATAKKTAKAKPAPAAKKTAKKVTKTAAPAKKTAGKSASSSQRGRSTDWQKRVTEIAAAEMSDAERFHAASALVAQSFGAAFINLFAPNDEGNPELIGAHEKAVTYYRELDEKTGPTLDSPRALPAATEAQLAGAPGALPIFGIEDAGPARINDVSPSSAILVPYLFGKEQIGVLVASVQEPQPHYTDADLEAIRTIFRLLSEAMVRRALHARTRSAKAATREAKRTADEAAANAAAAAQKIAELTAAHAQEIERLQADALRKHTEAIDAATLERRSELEALAQTHQEALTKQQSEHARLLEEATQASNARADAAEAAARKTEETMNARLLEKAEEHEARARESLNRAINEVKEQARQESDRAKNAYESQLSNIQSELEKERQTSAQLRGQIAELEARIKTGSADVEAQLQKMRAVHAEQLRSEKAEIEELFTDEIKTLQERLNTESKERGRESESLRDRLQKTSAELESLQGTLERTQGSLQESIQKSRKLEQDLNERTSELQRLQAEHQRKLSDAQAGLERQLADTTERERAASASAEALTSELAETRKHLEDYRSTFEETKSTFQRQLQHAEHKQEELRQTLEKERRESDKERSHLQARVDELGSALQQRETDLLAERHRIAEQLTAREKELNRANARLPELEEQVRNLSKQLEQAGDRTAEDKSKLQALTVERDELLQKSKRLERDLEREVARLGEETARHEDLLARERVEAEAAAADLKARTAAAENRVVAASRDLENARAEIERIRGEFRETERIKDATAKQLAEQTTAAEKSQEEVLHQKHKIEKLSGELSEMRSAEQDLRSQIGIHRDRETRLEQTIASMREEEHSLKSQLSDLSEKVRDLERNADSQLETIAGLTADLNEESVRLKKLEDDLKAAVARERGSRESGHLIAHLTNAISNIAGLSPKLDFMRKRGLPEREFDRVLLFSLLDDDSLRFEDGYQGDTNLADFRGFRIPLRETIFGQAVASGHAAVQTVKEKDAPHPDLAGPLFDFVGPTDKTPDARTLIFIPLREAEQVVGLLSFASSSNQVPDSSRIELLEQIGPLIAVSLRFEQNRAELEREHAVRSYADSVNRYLEGRFVRSVRRLHRLAGGLGTVAAAAREELSQELLTDVQIYSQAIVPGLDRGDGPGELAAWIRNLSARAEEKAGVSVSTALDEATVATLHKRLGGGFHNLFWIAEEAIENVIRHSKAKQLKIVIEERDAGLRFTIADDGDGLVRTAGSLSPTKGTGLAAIRNLLGNCGGNLEFGKAENGYGLAIEMSWALDYREA